MLDEIFDDLDSSFAAVLEALRVDLGKIRTGRANPAIFDNLRVDYYGTPTPLNQVGSIKVVDANLLTIQPWEKQMIPVIEKAILASDLGLNPANDGVLVRVPIPPLTGERRQSLVKQAKKAAEDRKVAARNHRRDANEMIKALEKDKAISEDDMHRGLKQVQDATDKVMETIDKLTSSKEGEILAN